MGESQEPCGTLQLLRNIALTPSFLPYLVLLQGLLQGFILVFAACEANSLRITEKQTSFFSFFFWALFALKLNKLSSTFKAFLKKKRDCF